MKPEGLALAAMARLDSLLPVLAAFASAGSVHAQADSAGTALVFALRGNVFDKVTLTPIAGAKVWMVGTDGSNRTVITDSVGGFAFVECDAAPCIKRDSKYSLLAEKEGCLVVKDQLSTVGLQESTTFIKEYYLDRPWVCGPWIYPVQFSKNSSALRPTADSTLMILTSILVENPNLVLEITGHCDQKEDPGLGEARSATTRADLVSRGIAPGRLVASSRGSQEPVIASDQIARLTTGEEREAAHALNRRVDFKVIRTDWKE